MKKQRRRLLAVPAALCMLSALAPGDVTPTAGSLLIFPEFDNTGAAQTLLTVTNTNQSEGVWVHFEYVNHETCLEFNRELYLTPDDTVTLLTSFHNPFLHRGYAYAYAQNADGQASSFNWLIGSMTAIDGIEALEWSVNAFTFKGIGDGNITDVDDDDHRDLDGVEYEEAFGSMLVPRFVATGFNELILVNLTGGSSFATIVDFAIYNDNEDFFSGQYQFDCWSRTPLLDIAPTFGNGFLQGATNHDPSEALGGEGSTTANADAFPNNTDLTNAYPGVTLTAFLPDFPLAFVTNSGSSFIFRFEPDGSLDATWVDGPGMPRIFRADFDVATDHVSIDQRDAQGPLGGLPSIGVLRAFNADDVLLQMETMLLNASGTTFSITRPSADIAYIEASGFGQGFDSGALLSRLVFNTPSETEYGWMRVEGLTAFSSQKTIEDPAILAVLVEQSGMSFGAASLPFTQGPGRKGSLLPHSPNGDNSD